MLPCFEGPGGPFQVVAPFGKGTIVLLGGRSPLENALFNRADNAAFAAGLVASRRVVRFGSAGGLPPTQPEQPGSIWGALPAAAKAALIQLAVAAVAFALVRARRLGRPVEEAPISPIPAGELVRATSTLYRRGRAAAFSASLLRQGVEVGLRRRLGLARGSSRHEVAGETARITGRDEAEVLHLLDEGPLSGDDELISLGRELEEVQRDVEATTR